MSKTPSDNNDIHPVYDKAKHHFLGNFPQTLPIEQAYVHIGMYLGWIIENHLYSDFFEDEAEVQIFRFQRREISCTILSEVWDGYLGEELFDSIGNAFTSYYYVGGHYVEDYRQTLVRDLPSIYHVHDSWQNYELIRDRISERFAQWKASQPSA